MSAQGSTKSVAILGGSGSPNDKGYFVDLTALQAAYPTGNNGWFAITGTPDAIWIWDSGTSAWVNSGSAGSVSSVFGRSGAVVAQVGDYNATQITNIPSGGISSITVQAAINELDTEKLTKNTAIVGATKTKITYDVNGLVIAGADATTADIADSTNKRYVTDANLTVIGNTSGTNTGDNAVNSLYSGLVSNATHTGDVTGSTALTIDPTAITGKTAVTAVGTDYVLISDTSDSGNLKKALVSDFGGSGGGTPGGADTQIQVNNAGVFAGYSKFRYIDAFGEINLGEENGYGGIVGAEATTVDANGSDLGVYGGIGNGYGNGGNLYVSGGAAGIAGSGGELEVSGGVAGTYEGDGGNITVTGGRVLSGDNYTGKGGDSFMSGGQGKIRGGNAGLIGGNSNAYGGTIYLEGGLGPIAGDISLSPGYSPGEITNGIETFAINAAGTGYAIYDRFTVNTGSVLAEFVVLDVGVSGEVNQIAQATLGSGYSVGTGFLTTNTVGTGTGLTINILTLVSGGNGKIYLQQPNTGFKVELDISALTEDHKVSIPNETGKLALLTDTRHKRRSTKKVPKFTTINTFDTSADYTYWWTGGGAGSTSFPTSGMYEGAGCYQISAVTGAITGGRFAIPGGAKDYRRNVFTFRVKVPSWSTISLLQVFFSTEATGPTNYYPIDLKSKITAPVDNEWMEIQIGPGDFSAAVGTPTWSAISHYWLNAQTSSGTQDVQFDILQTRESINFPTVCFTFDDSLSSQFTIALPELLSRGLPAEFYPIWNEVGTGGATATLDQLKDASKKGFTFGYHGGTAYTDIGSTALLQAEIAEEAKFLASNGLHGCDGGALPNGKFNKAILEELGITYAYNRDVSWLLNYPDYLPEDGLIHAVSPDSATAPATLTGFIDKAIDNNANITFALHGIVASSPTGAQILTSTLTTLLDYAITKQNEGKLKCVNLNALTYYHNQPLVNPAIVTRIIHGSTADTVRPSDASFVEWVGSVEPTNATDNDTWIQTP